MSLKKYVCLLFFTCIVSLAAQDGKDRNLTTLEEIVTHQSSCVKCIENNRLYLQEKNIFPTEDGLFLLLNERGDYIHLSHLLSDNKGCYLPLLSSRFQNDYSIEVRNKCPSCGERYIVKCTNEKCPSNKKSKGK